MFLFFCSAVSSISFKYIFYGYENGTSESYADIYKEMAKKYPDDAHYQKLCKDAIEAVSGVVDEFIPDSKKDVLLSDLSKNFSQILIDFNNSVSIDISNVDDKIIQLMSAETIEIKSKTKNVSKSIPFVYVRAKTNFADNIKFHTLAVDCINPECNTELSGEVTANNLIISNVSILQRPQSHSENKIFLEKYLKTIHFYENNVTIDSTYTLTKDISIMISPYIYVSSIIYMVLPEGVTEPRSIKIYFDEPNDLFQSELYNGTFNLYFYNHNKYDRNTTIGFEFIGKWENVRNFNLTLLASDLNRNFINITGIPKNINYTLSDDKIFHITESSEGGDDGGKTSHGSKSRTFCFALITFLIAAALTV
ncbi:hypothetical protein GPJ56_005952 [Histomonas meleagridis]|uniref:uncharacterized protein n=1 Tax=Histomonas meleagridis TaxID=135588 RepID=UPI00355A7FAF|nr:hypothetical protein GPJ56_005952 [Histomonas meleagridis]KAH0799358.1 hypothetical protein GO595_007759 [Histomonas meleagridis]